MRQAGGGGVRRRPRPDRLPLSSVCHGWSELEMTDCFGSHKRAGVSFVSVLRLAVRADIFLSSFRCWFRFWFFF